GRAYTLAEKAARVVVEEIERSVSTKHVVNHVGSMFQVFFGVERVANADEARLADRGLYSRFQQELMKYGVFIPPSQFESLFTSAAHDEQALELTIGAVKHAAQAL
ncbi:MAG: aspartate aminotransferase family protein, partial [Thermoprotei archaeon]